MFLTISKNIIEGKGAKVESVIFYSSELGSYIKLSKRILNFINKLEPVIKGELYWIYAEIHAPVIIQLSKLKKENVDAVKSKLLNDSDYGELCNLISLNNSLVELNFQVKDTIE